MLVGVDYIRFIDLNEKEDDVKDVVPDAIGQETGDYFSEPIFVDSGIPIGARPELTTELFVRQG